MKIIKLIQLTTGMTALSILALPVSIAQMGTEAETYGLQDEEQAMEAESIRPSSDIVGMDVKDSEGESIGSVNEIYIDVDSGEVIELAVSERRILGRSNPDLIDFDKVGLNGDSLEASVRKDEVTGSSAADSEIVSTRGQKAGLTDVVGLDIVDPGGETIGSVDEVYLDFESGSVAGLVVSTGGLLGLGADKVAVSLESIEYDVENGVLTAVYGAEGLQNAPEFREDDTSIFRNLTSSLQ